MAKSTHVLFRNPDWVVKKQNCKRISAKFITKNEAVRFATIIAIRNCSELYIHKENGRVERMISYGGV